MFKKGLLFGFFIISLLFTWQLFATDQAFNDPKAWTIDDVLNLQSAGSFDISPCGKWVVWVKSRPDKKENQQVSDLYLTSLEDSSHRGHNFG